MNGKIKTLAKNISESIGDNLLGIVTKRRVEAESLLNRKLPQSCDGNLYWESIYFSIDYITKKIPDKFSIDEKRILIEELHRNLVNWLIDTYFSPQNNPANYKERIKYHYYDTLNARNLAYSDPQNDNRIVFREILSEEFKEEKINIDKSFFDALASDIINSLSTVSVN